MKIKNKTYCDDCGVEKAKRYYLDYIIRDFCDKCAIRHKVIYRK